MNLKVLFLLFSLFILLSSDWINNNLFYLFPTGSRHLILFFSFLFLFLLNLKRELTFISKELILVIISLILIIICSFDEIVPTSSFILSFFSLFLFLMVFFFGYNTNISSSSFLGLLRSLTYLLLILSIQPLLNAIIRGEILRYDYGLFREVGAYGSFMNIGTISALTVYSVSKKRFFLFLSIFFSAVVFYTVLKKVMISNIFVWIFYLAYLSDYSKRIRTYLILAFLLTVAILSTTSFISDNIAENTAYLENVGSDGHVRISMYLTSFRIALSNFPFGSGLATFGSLGSIFGHYSSLYYQYGIDVVGANSESDVLNGHHTLLDTFWPHIVAELGLIGTLFYLYLYLHPFVILLRISKRFYRRFECTFFFVTCLIFTSIWEGFTLYTPEIPIFIFVNFGFSSLALSSLESSEKGIIK